MKDIIISVDSTSHKVNFPDEFLGIGYENLQGNLIFQFDNNFIGGQARLDISINGESGMIPNLTPYENGYILPIKSSLLTGSYVLMQLVIDETSLTQYSLTTDTEINPNKTYYEKVGNDYIVVENPVVGDLSQYYEANTPVFKTDIFQLKVKDSINAQETIPEQYPTWINTLNTLIGTINQKLGLVDTALTEMNNLNINVSDKVDGEVTITFTDKQGNQKEVKINDGRGIVSILKTSTSGNIDTYTITYTDDTTSTFEVTNGINGTDGRGIASIEKTGATGLIDTYTITYTDNTTSTFNVANGKGITNIEKISTNLLVDTYRISFNDGTTQNYEVTNGKGIVSIEKTSTEGLTDIYTITYNDETTTTFNVVNGKGIVSIEKTSTSGYVDTYTITYNDGTTSTYEVTNGEVSQAQLDEVKEENDYLNSIINQLPKVSSQGTILTLNNTINGKMNIELGTSELEQETTNGNNVLPQNIETQTLNGVTLTANSDGTYTLNGTASANTNFVFPYSKYINFSAGTYYVSCNTYTNITLAAYYNTSDLAFWKTSNGTFTLNDDVSQFRLVIVVANGGSFNNVVIKPMINTGSTAKEWEPYTNGPAPNPSFPMPVHTISGNNKVVVEGKNLFDKDNANIINAFVSGQNGLLSTPTNNQKSIVIKVQPNTTYTISGVERSSSNYGIFDDITLTIGTSIATSYSNIINGQATFTTGANSKWFVFLLGGGTETYGYNNVQLEKGSSKTNFEPYISQEANINLGDIEYCEIDNYKDEFVRSDGSNLFDKDNVNVLNVYIDSTNGNIGNDNNARTIYIPCKANTSYTISKIVSPRFIVGLTSTLPANGVTCLSYKRDDSATHLTLEGNANAKYIVVYLTNNYDSDIWNNIINSLMINEGATALPYEPYGIGNWGIRKNIGKYIFDGTENIRQNQGAYTLFIAKTILSNSNLSAGETDLFSNRFVFASSNVNSDGNQGKIYIGNNDLNINYDNGVTNPTDFKTWLTTHTTNIYYPLATPTTTQITGDLATQLETIYQYLLSYKGQTNISQINNDLPFVISASALLDLNTLVGE